MFNHMIDKLYCSYYYLISIIVTRCMRLVWRAVFSSYQPSSIASNGPVSWSASLLGVTYRQLISSYQHCSVCSSSSATPFPSCNHRFVNDGINIHVLLQCTQCSWLNRILKVSPHYFRCEIFVACCKIIMSCGDGTFFLGEGMGGGWAKKGTFHLHVSAHFYSPTPTYLCFWYSQGSSIKVLVAEAHQFPWYLLDESCYHSATMWQLKKSNSRSVLEELSAGSILR